MIAGLASVVRRSFDFSGTTGRRVFWVYVAFVLVTILVTLGFREALSGAGARSVATVLGGMVMLPLPALMVRRLHDTGCSGWWFWIGFVPYIGALGLLALCLRGTRTRPEDWPRNRHHRTGAALVALFGVVTLSRLVWAPYWIVSGSMKPTLLAGDYVAATIWPRSPRRGDVVVFRDETQGIEFIFRVAALPGETIAMQDGVPMIDGGPSSHVQLGSFDEVYRHTGPTRALPVCREREIKIGQTCTKTRLRETWPDGTTFDVLDTFQGRFDTMAPVTVPDGHLFVLGDHRDNAADSRFPQPMGRGFVPVGNVTGIARMVVFSVDGGSWTTGAFRWSRLLRRIG